MTGCQCKSGFFSLRDCNQRVIAQCTVCGRGMCYEHAMQGSNFEQCRDCWARTDQAADPNSQHQHDDNWAYGYRHNYYSSGYSPVYSGSHYHHYYDDYDTRSFHDRNREVDDDRDDARAGFGDS